MDKKKEKGKKMKVAEMVTGLKLLNEMVEDFLDRMEMDACEGGEKEDK